MRWIHCLLLWAWALCTAAQAETHVFELAAPDAKSVYLAGEMTSWEQGKRALAKGADGTWRLSVDLGPGLWLYKFIVDGRWIADPGPAEHDADGQGGQHSLIFIGAGPWRERPGVPRGQVQTVMVESAAWGRPMKVNVYLPPGFAAGSNTPVLWLLHGAGMDADQWLKTGHVERYMDNLVADGRIKPFVIVMPTSGTVPYDGASERFITEELRAWLARTHGLRTERSRSGVAGMSMGGTGALRLPLRHPELYGFGFALSGYFGDELIAELPPGPLPIQLALMCGRDDELVSTNRALVAALDKRRAAYFYLEEAGAHTMQYWSHRLVTVLRGADAYFGTGQLAPRAQR